MKEGRKTYFGNTANESLSKSRELLRSFEQLRFRSLPCELHRPQHAVVLRYYLVYGLIRKVCLPLILHQTPLHQFVKHVTECERGSGCACGTDDLLKYGFAGTV